MNARTILLAASAASLVVRIGLAEPVRYIGADEKSGSSRAVVVEGCALAHTGQLFPLDKQGELIGGRSVDAQMAQVLFNLEAALAAAGSGTDHLVKLNLYVDSPRTADRVRGLFSKRFRAPVLPAMSWVCTPLPHKALVALDAVAVVPGDGPAAVSRRRCEAFAGDARAADVAVLPRGEVLYVAGIPEKGETAAATAKVLQGLMKTIKHLGLDPGHVVQMKAFVGSMGDAAAVRQEIANAFAGQLVPPLVFVEWKTTASVEIELIAFAPAGKGAAPASAETVSYLTPPGAKASPVFSRVARVHGGKQIYVSGLFADQPGNGEAQVRSIFASLASIAKETGTDLRHLAKATYYVSDEDASTALNKLRPEFYDPQRPPAASKAMVQGVGMSGRSVTWDMIAAPAR